MKSILDFRPVNEQVVARCGAEPSLREMVYSYYTEYLNEDDAIKLSRDYCEQVESKETKILNENYFEGYKDCYYG